jgi:hypothetical protein
MWLINLVLVIFVLEQCIVLSAQKTTPSNTTAQLPKVPLTAFTAATEICDINYANWETVLLSMIHHENRLNHTITHVVISPTDLGYLEGFEHWRHMVTQHHKNNTLAVFVGLSKETCDYFEHNHYHHFCMIITEEQRVALDRKVNVDMMVGLVKVVGPLLLLKHNLTTIMTEMDIFWARDPLQDLEALSNKQYDMQVTSHVTLNGSIPITQTGELNIGLYYVRPTNNSIKLFHDMMRYSILSHKYLYSHRTYDQKLFDHFLRRRDKLIPPQWPELFADLDVLFPVNNISYRRLPGDLYTHNHRDQVRFSNRTIALHISWGFKPPSQRIYCAYTLGLMNNTRSYEPPSAYLGKTCFSCCVT